MPQRQDYGKPSAGMRNHMQSAGYKLAYSAGKASPATKQSLPDVVKTPSGRYKSMGRSGAYEKDMDYKPR